MFVGTCRGPESGPSFAVIAVEAGGERNIGNFLTRLFLFFICSLSLSLRARVRLPRSRGLPPRAVAREWGSYGGVEHAFLVDNHPEGKRFFRRADRSMTMFSVTAVLPRAQDSVALQGHKSCTIWRPRHWSNLRADRHCISRDGEAPCRMRRAAPASGHRGRAPSQRGQFLRASL